MHKKEKRKKKWSGIQQHKMLCYENFLQGRETGRGTNTPTFIDCHMFMCRVFVRLLAFYLM